MYSVVHSRSLERHTTLYNPNKANRSTYIIQLGCDEGVVQMTLVESMWNNLEQLRIKFNFASVADGKKFGLWDTFIRDEIAWLKKSITPRDNRYSSQILVIVIMSDNWKSYFVENYQSVPIKMWDIHRIKFVFFLQI